jgi:phosphoglycerate dehydrogenase-like enzyme
MRMADERVRVVVAGVPRSYQHPQPDGRWLTDEHVARITAVSPPVELIHTTRAALASGTVPDPGPDVLLIEASGDEPYLDEIPAESFARLVTPRLRWVQSCSSGVGHILNLGLLGDDMLLTNAAGVHANALAESVMAGILLHAKRLPERLDRQRGRVWQELHCSELRGATMCVIGTGNIGLATARLATAFGMRVIGVRRSPRPAEYVDECVGPERLHDALRQSDYVVIACPLTPETEGMLGAPEFAALKRGAYLLNVSRGKVVQERALLDALADGTLSGAYLDAHAQEPLPREHPFWTAPGVTVIPHDSHSSPLIGDNIVELFADNLGRYLAGEPLRNVVDVARGY